MDTENETVETLRLPLWRNCLEKMLNDGIGYGSTYTAEFFEKELKAERESMKFGLGISEIRKRLEGLGYYLNGRGLHGARYDVVPPENNLAHAMSHKRQMMEFGRRCFTLLSTTPLELLSAEHRANHERETEKAAKRMALLSRRNTSLQLT